jgi:predicted dehydrogenase
MVMLKASHGSFFPMRRSATQQGSPKRWALVGTGGIVRRVLAELGNHPAFDFRAVVSSDRQRALDFAAEFGIPSACCGLEELIARDDIDAVYIATLHPLHVPQTIACLTAGIPVLAEKPLAVRPSGVVEVIKAVEQTGVFAMEAMKTIFLPAMRRGIEWVEAGRLGDIREVRASFCFRSDSTPEGRHFNPDSAGGAILDVGYYGIEAARWFLGAGWEKIFATGSVGSTGVEEQALISLTYPQGRIASTQCAVTFNAPVTLDVLGTHGRLHIDQFNQAAAVDFFADAVHVERHEGAPGVFLHEFMEVHRCLDAGLIQSPVMPLSASHATSRALDEALRLVHGDRPPAYLHS